MIATSLTSERVALPSGGSALPYEWEGEHVMVRDDAETALKAIGALTDGDDTPEGRFERFTGLVFPDLRGAYCACDFDPAGFARMCDAVAWDVLGLDLSGQRACEEPVWDLEEDADRIRASFRQAYGLDWDEARGRISFAEFVALVGGCPYETPMGRAVYYRTPSTRPKRTKHNRKEVEEWERLHRAYALHRGQSPRQTHKGQDDTAMRAAFAALKRTAR